MGGAAIRIFYQQRGVRTPLVRTSMGDVMRIDTMDLKFLGQEQVIASYLLTGNGSAALIETGPTTCLDTLMDNLSERKVSPGDVSQVFVTHIHLDHSGSAGHLSELLPEATFYVHEVGYAHLEDPSKLMKSAARIYGDRMDELWGDAKPVPQDRLVALKGGGEEIPVVGGILTAHDTPGHAYHHLAFFDPESRSLFAGDVAGIRIPGHSYVRPPTPPPEIDVPAWLESLEVVRSLNPDALYPTHFGCYEDVQRHLGELGDRLVDWQNFVELKMDEGSGRDDIAAALAEKGDAEMSGDESGAGTSDSESYDMAGNYEMLTDGLMRYVNGRRKSEGG